MKTIAVVNQKGGVAKTTLTVNMSVIFAEKGIRTLLVDQDPQGNSTRYFLPPSPLPPSKTLFALYQQRVARGAEIIHPTRVPRLSIVPASGELAGISWSVGSLLHASERLPHFLSDVDASGAFDVCYIDTQPDLSIYTINAMMAAEWILIPILPEQMAVDGIKQLNETMAYVRDVNDRLDVLGCVITAYDGRIASHKEWEASIIQRFDARYLGTIHAASVMKAAADRRQSIAEYEKSNRAYMEHLAVAKKIAERIGVALA